MKISWKYITLLVTFLVSFVSVHTISNTVYACGGGGSSPDGITLKLRGVSDLAEAIKLKATLQKNEAIKCANISPDKTEICISILCPGAITEEQIIKAIKDAGCDASLPDYLTFKIDNLINGSDGERLRNVLNELPGVTTANINLDTKEVTINYYEGWIRFARKIIRTLEDNGFKAIVPVDTVTFKTEGMTEVEAHDVRAYLLGVFGVSNSDIDNEEVIHRLGKNNNKIVKYVLTVVALLVLWGTYCFESFADVSYADLFLAGRGYKPVEDAWPIKPLITYPTDGKNIPDNQLYREWCAKTFKNGEQIYEAYKEIAFEINYRAEPIKTDYWQTPVETRQSKQGDCEDSVFLFFSKLSELDIDGDIIWGWVADKKNSVAFAHVWYQLSDKRGRPYIVEGFSKEWNGIVPVEMLAEGEKRVPTLMLRHNQVNRVVDEMTPRFTESFEEDQFTWAVYMNNATMVKEIFQKLQVMFARYKGQLHQSLY